MHDMKENLWLALVVIGMAVTGMAVSPGPNPTYIATSKSMGFSIRRQQLLYHVEYYFEHPSWTSDDLLAHPDKIILLSDSLFQLGQVGEMYFAQWVSGDAIQMYRLSLYGYERAFGRDHPLTIDLLNQIGLYYAVRRPYIAKDWFQRALEASEKALGIDHPSTLDIACNLGNFSLESRNLGHAEKLFQRARYGREKAQGKGHISTIHLCEALARVYEQQHEQQQKWEKGPQTSKLIMAKEMYQEALEGYEKNSEVEQVRLLRTVSSLGSVYFKLGELDEAETMLQRALRGYVRTYNAEHSSTEDLTLELGKLYRKKGNLSKAGRCIGGYCGYRIRH